MHKITTKELENDYDISVVRQTSMRSLIMWNISKAIKINPEINLKSAIQETQERLQISTIVESNVITSKPENQYISCAILAWQQLGHNGIDGLYQFIEEKHKESMKSQNNFTEDKASSGKKNTQLSPGSFISYNDPSLGSTNDGAIGPVVKLPVDTTRIVMRVDNSPCSRKLNKPEKSLMNKIDAACCMDSPCLDRLTKLDKTTTELRTRAQKLARREAQRVELLERAEAAWRDLEMGYQRRLAAAQEKEENMIKHIQALIVERNGHKNACTTLAQQLREKADTVEKERTKLTNIEKEFYDNACVRLQLSEEVAHVDAELAELHCKSAQLDRDLQFKEEQIRSKLQSMKNEVDCARVMTHETERTMHAELSSLRDQITVVSDQLLEEDADSNIIKEELTSLRQEKAEIVEDLQNCQVLCSGGIHGKVDELNKKREKLRELKDKVIECQCKLPVDAAVEVKRTPSLAALCKCQPEETFSETCSCTSLRTTLLTNLLSDLFGGLQSELGGCESEMPCQLLKCLEDKHNWDKSSVIKTNLRNYFSKLLIGELEIAIATSIEKYHARWVGASCADVTRPTPNLDGSKGSDWQERAVEKRAQKLASKLAEQLFQQRADQLTAKAKDVLRSGPPPCECNPSSSAVYPVFVTPPTVNMNQPSSSNVAMPSYWRRTHQDVTQLKMQLEDLKKVSIKKEDLKMMEDNIVKVVQRSVPDKNTEDTELHKQIQKKNTTLISSIHGLVNTEKLSKYLPSNKLSNVKKKQLDVHFSNKPLKKLEQSYAVNLCLCSSQKGSKKASIGGKQLDLSLHNEVKKSFTNLPPKDTILQTSNVKQTKPITIKSPSDEIKSNKKIKTTRPQCRSDLACFHKPPSNTSIEKLLETIANWKRDLFKFDSKCTENKLFDENHTINSLEKNNISLKTNKSSDPTKNYVSKQTNTNITNSIALQHDLPVTTDSEYMGAINLEKSNENYCKCVIDIEHKHNQENSKFPNTCIRSEKCNCTLNDKNKKVSPPSKVSSTASLSSNKPLDVYKDALNLDNEFSGGDIDNNNPNNKDNLHDENQITKSSSLSNDCEYCIKFLGVTLANAYPRQNLYEEENKCLSVQNTTRKNIGKNKENDISNNNNLNPNIGVPKDHIDNTNVLNLPKSNIASCDCSDKYDEFKSIINDVFSKQRGDFFKNEDKALDTRSLNCNIGPESCVCCNIIKTDETKDLEVNAFYLLEEYLKGKLEEFKNSSCKSSCISSKDEERLFASILERVKQIIIDGTSRIACKCISENSTEGSWHRAYTLLHEYLKMKINKVKCLCESPDQKEATVLPEILKKVCNLIDYDFQRLRDICKCNNQDIKYNNFNTDLPERDNNNFQFSEDMVNTQHKNKDVPISSHTIAENISAQVSYNFGTETKSCEAAIANDKQDASVNNSTYKYYLCTECEQEKCACCNYQRPIKSVDFGKTEFLVNQFTNISKDNFNISIKPTKSENVQDFEISNSLLNEHNLFDNKKDKIFSCKSPYIGYTVDCSCYGSIGTCSCIKSIVTRDSDNISNIWNTITSNKLHTCDLSYIMDTVAEKNKENNIKLEKVDNYDPVVKSMCNIKTSIHGEEDIILKDSRAKLNKTFISVTTSDENINYETEEPIDWCDCSSSKSKPQKTDFSNNIYEPGDLYYPLNNLKNRQRSEIFPKKRSPINVPSSLSSNCDCNVVPLCHVKMLVENIEKKLIHSKCTCDSLCSKVCPIHSKEY